MEAAASASYGFKSHCGKEPEGFLGPRIKIDASGRPKARQPISLVGGIGQGQLECCETGDTSRLTLIFLRRALVPSDIYIDLSLRVQVSVHTEVYIPG